MESGALTWIVRTAQHSDSPPSDHGQRIRPSWPNRTPAFHPKLTRLPASPGCTSADAIKLRTLPGLADALSSRESEPLSPLKWPPGFMMHRLYTLSDPRAIPSAC